MITIQQIKAARSLLDWNQDDLAKAANVSKPAIANLERGTAQPRVETLNAITRAMEEGGVEFTDGPGVRLRGEILKVEVFEGKNTLYRLWQDAMENLPDGGERLISGVDEQKFEGLISPLQLRRIIKELEGKNITNRMLIREGDTYLVESPQHYRWVPEASFSMVPYYVYGDRYAILIMEPSVKAIVIHSKAIADSYRRQFEAIWNNGKIPRLD